MKRLVEILKRHGQNKRDNRLLSDWAWVLKFEAYAIAL